MIPRVTEYRPRHDLDTRVETVGHDPDADLAARTARERLNEQMAHLRRVDSARQKGSY